MKKIWEQMQGNEHRYRHAQALMKRSRKRRVTAIQKAAKRDLKRISQGLPLEMDQHAAKLLLQKIRKIDRKEREREAFHTLRKAGML